MDDIQNDNIKTLNEYLISWKNQIVENIEKSGKEASGRTARSFAVVMGVNWGLIEANQFYKVLETGRKPGKMPPVQRLYDWLLAKGISADYNLNVPLGAMAQSKNNQLWNLAWAISKKIAEKGTKLYQMGGRKDIYSNVINDENVNKLVEDMGNKVFTSVYNYINTLAKDRES